MRRGGAGNGICNARRNAENGPDAPVRRCGSGFLRPYGLGRAAVPHFFLRREAADVASDHRGDRGLYDAPDGGVGFDVGCGSGALAIACAKRNPGASFIGIDRWGREYASYSKSLCENNAMAEGAGNVRFQHGDASALDSPDNSFDAVTSNYVYHNIPGDRQKLLLETLRVLKPGGTFAIHDIFSRAKYGDMQAFVRKLRHMGYETVELIDTTDGIFMTKREAGWMGLSGSALLVGRK